MWKAVSLAIGITAIMVGVELFLVQELEIRAIRAVQLDQGSTLNSPFQQVSFSGLGAAVQPPATTWLYKPRDWMPWSMLAIGTIIVIYTFTLPVRRREGGA